MKDESVVKVATESWRKGTGKTRRPKNLLRKRKAARKRSKLSRRKNR